MNSVFQNLWQLLADLLFPPRCVACQHPGPLLCASCLASVAHFPEPRCPRCDLPLVSSRVSHCTACARHSGSALDGMRVLGPHAEPLRDTIHALKYQGRTTLAVPLGEMLAERWRAAGTAVDGLVPVPLHPDRQRERGFNQSDLLAHAMAEPLGLPVWADLLQRVRPTRPQVGLARQERLQNVADAFRASPEVEGGRWLLVDDVCTTSATLEACAQALRLRGAGAVWAITLARPQGTARDVLASKVDGP